MGSLAAMHKKTMTYHPTVMTLLLFFIFKELLKKVQNKGGILYGQISIVEF